MIGIVKQVIRRVLSLGLAVLILWFAFGRYPLPAITDDLSKLEPEMCSTSNLTAVITRFFTAVIPLNVGSPTDSLEAEQIALISQDKSQRYRKLWVLRMPAAYIMSRPCDSGRQNWVGTGEYVRVSQRYGLGLILIEEQELPVTRSTEGQRKAGLPVYVELDNSLVNSERRHRSNAGRRYVIGRVLHHLDQPSCAEQPSSVAGLVTFKRINSEVISQMDCEGQFYGSGVFARKVGDRSYDIVIGCSVRCRMHSDYHGWPIELSFDREHLDRWQTMYDRVTRFLADHTFHLDRDEVDQRPESLYEFMRRARSNPTAP
jgi:hypothetical protein